ncbi:MAG TPA: alpha/beta hydrolase-fold protein [Marinagarivorans sp.]
MHIVSFFGIASRVILCVLCVVFTACKRDKPFSWVNPPADSIAGLQHHIVPSQFEKADVGVSILLPANYAQNPQKQYSVIYYLHGSGGNESSEIEAIQQFVKRSLKNTHQMPIIVFPNGGRSGYFGPTENRIIQELIPYIESNFRTSNLREGRLLLGFSMGGTASMRLALKYPDTFTGAVSLGGRLWSKDGSLSLAITENAQQLKALGTRLLFIQGEKDGPDQFQGIVSQTANAGISVKTHVLPNTSHNLDAYLEQSVPYLASYLQDF